DVLADAGLPDHEGVAQPVADVGHGDDPGLVTVIGVEQNAVLVVPLDLPAPVPGAKRPGTYPGVQGGVKNTGAAGVADIVGLGVPAAVPPRKDVTRADVDGQGSLRGAAGHGEAAGPIDLGLRDGVDVPGRPARTVPAAAHVGGDPESGRVGLHLVED